MEQGVVAHHEGHRDRDGFGAALAGEAFHEGVGHGLVVGAGVALGAQALRGTAQGGVDRDALGCGEQGGDLGHRVGHRARGDPTVVGGAGGAGRGGGGVEVVGVAVGGIDEGVIAAGLQEVFEVGGLGAQGLVEVGALLGGEVGAGVGEVGGLVLGELAAGHRGQGVGHLVDQDSGQGEVSLSAVG